MNAALRPWGSGSAPCSGAEAASSRRTTGVTNQPPCLEAGVSTGTAPPSAALTKLGEPDRMVAEKYSTFCTHTRSRSHAWLIGNGHLKDGRHCLRDVVAIDLVPKEVAHVPRSDASPVLLDHHLARLAHDEQGLNHLLFVERGALLQGECCCPRVKATCRHYSCPQPTKTQGEHDTLCSAVLAPCCTRIS